MEKGQEEEEEEEKRRRRRRRKKRESKSWRNRTVTLDLAAVMECDGDAGTGGEVLGGDEKRRSKWTNTKKIA